MAINIKFTKFDNTPWGFRLAGGSDFPQPLTVIRVTEGSLGECMGLKVGDVVVRLNDQSIINLTHGQAHEALVHAGNNFVLGVQREEETRKAIVPYKIALADLPPVFPEQILKEETVIERYEEENIVVEPLSAEDEIRKEKEKLAEEKPVDANSEIVTNKNLTDDEIAQLILEEEELLSDKGLLGVNFKKLKPRASILKDSKVLEELQNIAIAEPERVQELKRTSTFLQKPQRPIPKVKSESKVEEDEGETYKVVIKKQDKKTVIARLVEKGLLPPGSESIIIKTPEPPEPSKTKRRTSRCARAHYVERILLQNISAVVTHFRPKPKMTRVFVSRMKGRYLATYLRRKSLWLMSLITTLFQFLLQRPSVSESSNLSKIHERRLSFKGRYFEHVLQKNVAPVLECVNETCFIDDQLKMFEKEKEELKSTRTKGYYIKKCLHRQNLRLKFALMNLLDYDGLSCTSRNEFPVATDGTSNDIVNDSILNEEEIDKDASDLKISEWHEDGPACPLQKEPLIINTSNNSDPVEEEIIENDRQILECNSNPVLFEETNECTDLAKPTDVVPEDAENDKALSKFLQSAEDYVSAEVFHRGSRRLSRPRKSVDITSKEDDETLSKFLQSAEDYVSAEVFHRGNRRLSKSRKSIDTSKENDKALSKFLQSAEDYVSAEVFHRGSRRLSRSHKREEQGEEDVLTSVLRSTSNYVSSEMFHRGSRRLSRSFRRESVSLAAPTLWGGLKNMHLNLSWFSFRITKKNTKHIEDCEEKIDSEIELDNRRLSFVPTILYRGITNRIGIDFTKFVVYAFVPSTQEFICRAEEEGKSDSRPASKAEETEEKESDEVDEVEAKERPEFKEEDRPESCKARLTQDEQTVAEEDSSVSTSDPVAVKTNNKEKIKQLVSTEISLEQQLENVQRQLLALKQLPSEIENHLKIVSEQLHMIMELSGVQRSFGNGNGDCRGLSEENTMPRQKDEEELKQQEEDTDEEDEEFTETYDYIEEIACLERRTSSRSTPQVIEPSDDEGEMEEEEAETKELDGMISVKSANEEGSRVKKFIVSYETKVLKSPSPAPSHGSFEPDPKLSPKDQVIQELQQRVHKKGKKHSQELWPQAKQLELTQGRRWRCPNDFFNDEMIAEVLTCQAEVIRGKAMGVNFKKYEKTNLPNYDYLMNSSVYKMIHKMEREPKRGIPVRPAKVNAAEDIIERVKSPALSVTDDRSARSVSH
ncbi:ZASP protein, partial [Acromyrmex insinuator]